MDLFRSFTGSAPKFPFVFAAGTRCRWKYTYLVLGHAGVPVAPRSAAGELAID